MKRKIYLLILIFAICFFPAKALGIFATPDDHIYSAPFGVQRNNTGVQKMIIPPNFNQADIGKVNESKEPNGNLLPPTIPNLNNAVKTGNFLFPINFWLSALLVILIALFIFLKRKKKMV